MNYKTKENLNGLKNDFKVLVNLELEYRESDWSIISQRLHSLVFSIQHTPGADQFIIKKEIMEKVIYEVLEENQIIWDETTEWNINPSGSFILGGLSADSGATNRKQMADLYGSSVGHGGGGVCGKDLTKIDRLGVYYARWVAKNIVAAGLAKELELKVTFSMAKEEVLSFDISRSLGCSLDSKTLVKLIKTYFPSSIPEIFKWITATPFSFSKLCNISNFGNFIPDLPWEKLDKVSSIRDWASKS